MPTSRPAGGPACPASPPASRQPPLRLRTGPTLKSAAQHESMAAGPRVDGDASYRPITASQPYHSMLAHCCFFAGSHVNERFNGTCGVLPIPTHGARELSLPLPGHQGSRAPASQLTGRAPSSVFWLILAATPSSVAGYAWRAFLALWVFPVAGSCPACFQRRDVRLPLSRVSLHISHAWHNATAFPSYTCHGTRQLLTPGTRPGTGNAPPGVGINSGRRIMFFVHTLCSGAGAVSGPAPAKTSTTGRGFACLSGRGLLVSVPCPELGPVGASVDGGSKRMQDAHHRSASTGKAFVACDWLAPAAEPLLPFAQPSRPPGWPAAHAMPVRCPFWGHPRGRRHAKARQGKCESPLPALTPPTHGVNQGWRRRLRLCGDAKVGETLESETW